MQGRGFEPSRETSDPAAQCSEWPLCLPNCVCDHSQSGDQMSYSGMHTAAVEIALERNRAERRRIIERDMVSQYHPGENIFPGSEELFPRVPRSYCPRFCPIHAPIPRRVPETLVASLLGQRRNAISLTLPPRRVALTESERAARQATRLSSGRSSGRISGRSFGHISGRSSRLSPEYLTPQSSPPASNSYALSSDMPDIGCLNMNDEGESSRRASRRSNQRDTPPQVTGDQLAQETDGFWLPDAARQSALGSIPADHVMAYPMAEGFARMSLPESEEQMSEGAVSTAAENGSEPDELQLRLGIVLMDGIEHTGKNQPKKD